MNRKFRKHEQACLLFLFAGWQNKLRNEKATTTRLRTGLETTI